MSKPVDWSEWSEQQLRCLRLLHFAVPLHATHLKWAKVHSRTIESLITAGLVRREHLYDEHAVAGMPFLSLTQAGLQVKRDRAGWNRRVSEAVAGMFASVPA